MTTVNLRVTTPTGEPVEGAQVDITLTEPGVEYIGENLVLPTSTKGKTDLNGRFQVDLAPVNNAPYIVVVFDPKTNRRFHSEFFVPESELSVDVSDLVLLPKPSGITYDATALAAITSDRVRAEQAADRAEVAEVPDYIVKTPTFTSVGGINTLLLTLSDANAFMRVEDTEGVIIIPDSNNEDYRIGTAITFVNDSDPLQNIDISFVAQNNNVAIEYLGITPVKLVSIYDFIILIKIDENRWKIMNLASGGSGNLDITAVENRITANEANIVALEGWREAFNNQLIELDAAAASNTNSIAAINNAIASLVNIVTVFSTTIDDRINEALPSLPDLTSYVNAAANSAANALTSEIAAGNSATAANDSVGYAKEWATKDEDVLVSAGAGGNLVDEYSAKHFAAKAQEVIDNFTLGFTNNAGALAQVNETEDGFSFLPIEIETYFLQVAAQSRIYSQRFQYGNSNFWSNSTTADETQIEKARSFKFAPDGLSLVMACEAISGVRGLFQFNLNTPRNLNDVDRNSLAFLDTETVLGIRIRNHTHFEFSPDGLIFLISDGDEIHKFTLTSPRDITTIQTPAVEIVDLDAIANGSIASFRFSTDGLKFFFVDTGSRRIRQLNLLAAHTLTGWAAPGNEFSLDYDDSEDFIISDDETQLVVLSRSNNVIYRYRFDDPGDLSTLILRETIDTRRDIEADDVDNARALDFSPGGAVLFLATDRYFFKYPTNRITLI